MVKLTIQGKAYEMPKRLSIEQWRALLKFDYHSVEDWPKIMALILEEEVEVFKRATVESLTLAISFVIALMNQRTESKVRDFNTILFGEFVDLDIYVVQGIEKHIEDMLAILSPDLYWSDDALWVLDQYQQFRIHTYRQYAGLFGLNEPRDDDEDLETIDAKKVAKGWYRIIVDLADNDVLNIDAITEQPLKKILNFMALKKEKQMEENFKQLQQKRQHDLSRNRK